MGADALVPWLWEIVGEADDLAFGCFGNRIVSALADRIVRRNLQLFDIGADHYRALVGGEVPVGQAEAIDVQIAIAKVLVLLVVEGFQRGRLVGLEGSDSALQHRLSICGRRQLRLRKAGRTHGQKPVLRTRTPTFLFSYHYQLQTLRRVEDSMVNA